VHPAPRRLADVSLPAFWRGFVTAALLAAVGVLFVAMVLKVLLAAFLGVVIAMYLRPVYAWLGRRLGRPAPSALLTLLLFVVPVLAVLTYGYVEVRGAATYLSENTAEVAAEVQASLDRLPFVATDARAAIENGLGRAADLATGVPEGVQDAIGAFSVAVAVFLFTAFYVLTDAESIVGYLRSKVPARYAALTERLERNARGVLYGAIYSTLVTQSLKGLWVLVLMLAFGVPLPFTLALLAFAIGFFPVVGSWTVYLPAAGYVLVFQDAPLKAAALAAVAFVVSTPLLSFYVRPKLAADRSHVLNFYWMFIGLIAGVYTFGIPGILLGPLLVGLLKALLDVVTDDESWRRPPEEDEDASEGGEHGATVLTEEGLRHEHEPAAPTDDGGGNGLAEEPAAVDGARGG
jgi:predicted PurR-regulated permease PerM